MDWVLIGGIVFSVWAATRVLGNERQRRLDEQTAMNAAALATSVDSSSAEVAAH